MMMNEYLWWLPYPYRSTVLPKGPLGAIPYFHCHLRYFGADLKVTSGDLKFSDIFSRSKVNFNGRRHGFSCFMGSFASLKDT